jgi:hypothetical protein
MYKMKIFSRTLFIWALLAVTNNINAQNNKITIGKKYTMVTETKTSSAMSLMGQQVDIDGNVTAVADIAFQTISNANTYKLLLTVKRLKGSIGGMGQQQGFDSDDEGTKNNPLLGEMLKAINQPQEMSVENGQTVSKENGNEVFSQMGNTNTIDVSKLQLGLKGNQINEGYRWSDSTISELSKQINHYRISKILNNEVEVTVNTDMKINGTIKQSGIEMKQNLIGSSTSVRLYNQLNGLLISEKSAIEMTGTTEIMGMSGPLTFKGSTVTTVKE